MRSVAFTGHRPNKLPGGYNWATTENYELRGVIQTVVVDLICKYKTHQFYFGGALGIDQMAFSVVHSLKEQKYHGIQLILAMPFRNQDAKWFNAADKERLIHQQQVADKVVIVDELLDTNYTVENSVVGDYHSTKMQLRNMYMVDHSEGLIAIWDTSSGGTANCVRYAKSLGKEIIHINPKTKIVKGMGPLWKYSHT